MFAFENPLGFSIRFIITKLVTKTHNEIIRKCVILNKEKTSENDT